MMISAEVNDLTDCWEAGMDYFTAIGCSKIVDCEEARAIWAELDGALEMADADLDYAFGNGGF